MISEESLYLGIEKLVADNSVGDIGSAIQKHVEKNYDPPWTKYNTF